MTFNINIIKSQTPETNGELWINYSISEAGGSTPSFYIDRYVVENGSPVDSSKTRLAAIETTEETELSDIYIDRTWVSNQTYIYRLTAEDETVLYTSTTVSPTLRGVVITAPDGESYFSELDWDISMNHNMTRVAVTTLAGRYPFIISNTLNDYDSGSLTALFLQFDPDRCDYITDQTWAYRKQVEKFLTKFQPILIRTEDGRAWIAAVVNNTISYSKNSALHNVTTQFEWSEIGNINEPQDLKDFGFAI